MTNMYKESKNKNDIVSGPDFNVDSRQLNQGEKDYSGLIIGDYKVIEPVLIDKYLHDAPFAGWICLNTKTGLYKIIPNLPLSKMYIKYCSDDQYFGMEYVTADLNYSKLSVEGFRNEFLAEVEKGFVRRHDEFGIQTHNEYINDIDKYVYNVKHNIETLKSLNYKDFCQELSRIIERYHFVEINNVSSFKHCLYLVVLDEYRQFYIGKTTTNLKNRMRKHWSAKTIPSRHLGTGSFEHSKIKFDDFQMFDTTRIFVCNDIEKIIDENTGEAQDRRIEFTNTFGIEKYDDFDDLAISERIVINNCKCIFCLSDRTPLMSFPYYSKYEQLYKVNRSDLIIKQYLRLDEKDPFQAFLDIYEG